MKKFAKISIIVTLIPILFVGAFLQTAFANTTLQCPFPHKIETTADQLVQKLDQCMMARNGGDPNSIKDFHCPSGDLFLETQQPITQDLLAINIAINVLGNEADAKMKKYMRQLMDIRTKDTVALIQGGYSSCINGDVASPSFRSFYQQICDFSFVTKLLNSNSQQRIIVGTTHAFPQELCEKIAESKRKMWMSVWDQIVAKIVNKSYESDRARFVEGVQGQYRSIIGKFHTYQKIIFRASSKITHYIREAVK